MSLDIYVDACIVDHPRNGAGIGIVCPSFPQLNASEPVPKSLGFDINICEMYAIIRGMERAIEYGKTYRVTVVSDSQSALGAIRSALWPSHFHEMKNRFLNARQHFTQIDFRHLSIAGDGAHAHKRADEFATQGARNY